MKIASKDADGKEHFSSLSAKVFKCDFSKEFRAESGKVFFNITSSPAGLIAVHVEHLGIVKKNFVDTIVCEASV